MEHIIGAATFREHAASRQASDARKQGLRPHEIAQPALKIGTEAIAVPALDLVVRIEDAEQVIQIAGNALIAQLLAVAFEDFAIAIIMVPCNVILPSSGWSHCEISIMSSFTSC